MLKNFTDPISNLFALLNKVMTWNGKHLEIVAMHSEQIVADSLQLFLPSFHLDHCGALPWFLEKVISMSHPHS